MDAIGRRVRDQRLQRGWSQQQLAEATNMSQNAMSRLELGKVRPDINTLRAIASVLAVSPATFGLAVEEGDEDMRRRQFLGATAIAAIPVTEDARVGNSDAAALEAALKDLVDVDQEIGGNRLLAIAKTHVRHINLLLNDASCTMAVRQRLTVLLSNLAGHTGWIALDAGRFAEADRYNRESIAAAVEADNELASTHAFVVAAFATVTKSPRRSLQFAEAAVKSAARGRAGPRTRAIVQLRAASAYGMLNDVSAVRNSVTCAWKAFESSPSGEDGPWTEFLSPAELEGLCGCAYEGAGDLQRAAQSFRAAAADMPNAPRNRASWELALANVLLQAGELAEAYAVASSALPTVARLSSTRVSRQLSTITQQATLSPRSADARLFLASVQGCQ